MMFLWQVEQSKNQIDQSRILVSPYAGSVFRGLYSEGEEGPGGVKPFNAIVH